jgi:Tfp pilus assembly protein FimT
MFVAATAAILAAAAVPQLSAGIERTRTANAARYLAGRFAFARSLAVARSVNVAVLIAATGGTFTSGVYADGNGNGVRTREIAAGIDSVIADPVRLSDQFPHVQLYLTDPDQGPTTEMTALLSFTPVGTASSRTIYVRGRDGSRYAVRVLGATGRTRVLRYVAATKAWVEVL